jgi:chemotaxis-related protein WspB
MTVLVFSVDGRRYALDAADVIAVVPNAPLRLIDAAPPWVAGILRFSDQLVPVVDLCQLQAARSSRRAFSTRIVLVRYPRPAGDARTLGLLAEGVTDVADIDPGQWRDSGLATPDTPWLGPLAELGEGLVQRIAIQDLLPPAVRERLFP